MLAVVLISGHLMEINQVTETNWWVLAIISVTTGTGAILLYYYGLKHVKASHSTLMELFFPITTIVLDYFVNGVMLSPIQWISASVMVFAILKASAK
jgi:drug/metabolite transporter (DMT)-like permease